MLKGYKTYILAGAACVSVVASYLVGDISLTVAINGVLASGIVAALRDAISGVAAPKA